MRAFLHHYLARLAALGIYVAVYVFAVAIHHHHNAEAWPNWLSSASGVSLLQASTPDDSDDEDEDHCLLCSVLHLAQILPTLLHADVMAPPAAEEFLAGAVAQPFPIRAITHSRAPPA
jgi:hypothetical protein